MDNGQTLVDTSGLQSNHLLKQLGITILPNHQRAIFLGHKSQKSKVGR